MKKKVLVVEDSILMQRVIADIINASEEFEVSGFARDVAEGWAKFRKYKPDLITLDFELPGENGLILLNKIMEANPTPVLMLSAHTKDGVELTMRALAMGAIDFFTKPSGPISIDLYKFKDELIDKLKTTIHARLTKPIEKKVITGIEVACKYYIGIASSTGGVQALNFFIPSLPAKSGLRLSVVQHMPRFFTASLARHLNERSELVVKEAKDGDLILPDEVLVAPGGYHLKIDPSAENVILTNDPPRHGVKPSADILFESMADTFKNKAIGVILTGMGCDGAAGFKKIKEQGGLTIVQDPSDATISSMPQSAIDTGTVDCILPLKAIPNKILELTNKLTKNKNDR